MVRARQFIRSDPTSAIAGGTGSPAGYRIRLANDAHIAALWPIPCGYAAGCGRSSRRRTRITIVIQIDERQAAPQVLVSPSGKTTRPEPNAIAASVLIGARPTSIIKNNHPAAQCVSGFSLRMLTLCVNRLAVSHIDEVPIPYHQHTTL